MGQLSPQQVEGLRRVDSNAQHLAAMINEILDLTRIEAGRMPLRLSKFDLSALVAEVMAEMEPIIARSDLAVTSQVSPERLSIRSDRQKVKQILVNLLSNALKFTREGSVRIHVTKSGAKDAVSIAVKDTGIGIAEADQKRVFEVFQQIDTSATRASGGAGLGLAICRRLAEMLDGSISLRSRPGEGSAFTLRIPIRPRSR
jgi:signal transduction histidine kinase